MPTAGAGPRCRCTDRVRVSSGARLVEGRAESSRAGIRREGSLIYLRDGGQLLGIQSVPLKQPLSQELDGGISPGH